jgi:hypothetical protein
VVTADRARLRATWLAARRRDGLTMDAGGAFACGSLGSQVDALDLRIRFLPADPFAAVVRLDEAAAQWLTSDRRVSYDGSPPQLGSSSRATSDALVRFDRYRDDAGWTRFLALHRDGGLDFGDGDTVHPFRDHSVVALRPLVGLVWHLADMQLDACTRWGIVGPFEVTVGLVGVRGARLGAVAEGWKDAGDLSWHPPTCVEDEVLLRFECDEIEPEALAYDAGERIENTFGSTDRRFLANRGEFEGRFDPRF